MIPITPQPTIKTSINITPEFYKLCKNNGIKFTEAFRVGVSMMLAERGHTDYDNKLNLYRKMQYYKDEMEKLMAKHNKDG